MLKIVYSYQYQQDKIFIAQGVLLLCLGMAEYRNLKKLNHKVGSMS